MDLTGDMEAQQQDLFTAISEGREGDVLAALVTAPALPPGALVLKHAGGIPALHWAAALGFADGLALTALVAAGGELNARLPMPPGGPHTVQPAQELAWVQQLTEQHLSRAQSRALAPGMTPLAVACRLGHEEVVRQLLLLGADPNGAGEVPPGVPKPYTPLSAVVLSSPAAGGAAPPAAASIAGLLLQAGADPLAPSRRRCSTLRCACGSEFIPNQTLPLLLDHLEGLLAGGRLALATGNAAAEVMVAAARCARVRLFNVAHEFALAASGRRGALHAQRGVPGGGRRRSVDSSSSSGEEEEEEEEEDAGQAGDEAGMAAMLSRLAAGQAAWWQPSSTQLFEVLRSAALGGSPPILRTVLKSPLPFAVRQTDGVGKGLMAICAIHSGSAEGVALLHRAGAQLDLTRLLFVLDKTVAAAPVQALLACQRPQVPVDDPTTTIDKVASFTCPIHRLLHRHAAAPRQELNRSPSAGPREVMVVLETLLAAGYRRTVYHGLRKPKYRLEGAEQALADPFDPFLFRPAATPAGRRLVLVAKGGAWSPVTHADWPTAFKDSARSLLLASHRQPCGGDGSVAQHAGRRRRGKAARLARAAAPGPACLPAELVLKILGMAAFPVSVWM